MRFFRAVIMRIIICCLIMTLCCSIGRVEQAPWDCPECGRTGNTKNYCGGCGKEAPWIISDSWDCPKCGRKGNTENYCAKCGQSSPWIEDASGKLSRDEFSKVGNIVRFGHYEQDNNLNNGSEEVEWIVLDVQDGKSLLISKYGLDAKPYNTTAVSVTWGTSTLRKWLNSDFLKAVFTAKEQSAILTTKVDNGKSQGYIGYGSQNWKSTQDQIFLLSYHEAFDLYFKSDNARKCVPTDYAKAQGTYTNNIEKVDGRATGCWWLRSPGLSFLSDSAAYVDDGGTHRSLYVDRDSNCVRPALWINLESNVF